MDYRSTVHPSTNCSPARPLFGREIRTSIPGTLDIDHRSSDQAVYNQNKKYKKMKEYFDKKKKVGECDLNKGDLVLLRQNRENKLSTRFENREYRVVKRKGNAVILSDEKGKLKMRNVREVKRLVGESRKKERKKGMIYIHPEWIRLEIQG